ncbi:MAG: hypothetical protein HC819_03685 [Cyclobacteriaceae bacterium]|nr:hypothetical protein [Cyclobacteriaceae bacterium]
MEEYKLLKQKFFEGTAKFEKRINETCQQGWKPVSLTSDHGSAMVLLQKVDKFHEE